MAASAAKGAGTALGDYIGPADGARLLSGIALFARFRAEELEELATIGRVVRLKPWAYAVIEGEPTRGLYILLSGRVSVYKADQGTNNMARLATLEEGAHFGEFTLFDAAPRSATVAAESACSLLELDAKDFHRFLERMGPDLQLRFYKTCAEELAQRFRALNGDYLSAQRLLWKFALRRDGEGKA
jgi:CRP-like cAMP-binding protein